MANLEESGNRIPDAWSVKLTFLLIVTFYFSPFNLKKCISKIKGVMVLKRIYSETAYMCVRTNQISIFYHNSNSFRRGIVLAPPPQNEPQNIHPD